MESLHTVFKDMHYMLILKQFCYCRSRCHKLWAYRASGKIRENDGLDCFRKEAEFWVVKYNFLNFHFIKQKKTKLSSFSKNWLQFLHMAIHVISHCYATHRHIKMPWWEKTRKSFAVLPFHSAPLLSSCCSLVAEGGRVKPAHQRRRKNCWGNFGRSHSWCKRVG